MKKKMFLQMACLLMVILLSLPIHAQKLFIDLGSGYGLGAAPVTAAREITYKYNGTTSTTSYKLIPGTGSLGRGVPVNVTIGSMFSKYVGIELGAEYLLGNKISNKVYYEGLGSESSEVISYSAKTLRLIPALRFSVPGEKVKPYLRTGLVVSVFSTVNANNLYVADHDFIEMSNEEEFTYKGNLSLGFMSGLGVSFQLTRSLNLFTEANLITQSWSPRKMELTKKVENGVDVLEQVPQKSRVTEFVDHYKDTDVNQSLKVQFPLSRIGIVAGLQMKFGK